MSNANQPGAAWAGRGDPFVLIGGHIVSPEDEFGEIGRMANGDLRRPRRIAIGDLGGTIEGDVIFGSVIPATGTPKVDVVSGVAIAAVCMTDVATDAFRKTGDLVGRHFTNAEANLSGLAIDSLAGTSALRHGGGRGNFNAATIQEFYTAPDTTTLAGTLSFLLTHSAVADDIRGQVFDVSAGALKQLSRGIADSGGAGFRLLRVPN